MKVFADTSYFIALLSARDELHAAAVEWIKAQNVTEIVTTIWVLVELADAMNHPDERSIAAPFIERLKGASDTRIIPPMERHMWSGLHHYRSRADKKWSLTDCISFIVMEEENLRDALTGDHHFEQAGFTVLLQK